MPRALFLCSATLLFVLVLGLSGASPTLAADPPSLKVVSPANGDTITTTDIPVTVQVSNFVVSAADVGMPDKPSEGHVHVMIDGSHMGVLFNFYTTPTFTLSGKGVKPGLHTLVFDLATNTHVDLEQTAVQVKINYQPTNADPAPAPVANAGVPSVKILSPKDGETVGPKITFQVQPTNFTPDERLEGKANIAGYGHYHVFVDMSMAMMMPSGTETPMANETPGASHMMGMMNMAGMVLMPGNNTFTIDLSAWHNGKHVIIVEPVHNDHTSIEGAQHAMVTISLQGAAGAAPAAQPTATAPEAATATTAASATATPTAPAPTSVPTTGGDFGTSLLLLIIVGVLILAAGLVLRVLPLRHR